MRRWRKTQRDGPKANSDSEQDMGSDKDEAAGPEMGTRRGTEGEERERDTLMCLAVKRKSFCST